MSWLLFLDESGHDHRTMPYEVNGGVALHASKLWPFIQAVRTLEQSTFGVYLHDHGSEIKGSKLLGADRFEWEKQSPRMDDQARRKHVTNFLNSSRQGRSPRRDEFTAFGQASIQFAEGVCQLLEGHGAVLFAAIIPRLDRPARVPVEVPRKDIDRTEKDNDRELARRMERYFSDTATGLRRSQWVVPSPLFVDSDMAYGVQVADLCIYALNWGYRLKGMDATTRAEIEPFVWLLEHLIWRGDGERGGQRFKTQSVVYVPDPYTPRDVQKEKKEVRPLEPP